ncbi:DUF2612 domain-containing protein [Clostridium estertheticum]|uniref:DUF2612 domain-containing protein n=1 Tax=Clostridium estertheticum TaxID=238834 RepID=UPI001C7D514E|nr:DUF2612 domain-containing protein [Clostridium estertheticum]MBX4266529.1 DUF2612 domain-containing protein [Clostridium estertheticum]WLC88131.1 DUF2612 domain-containing protein [Clostridium estertheticum]
MSIESYVASITSQHIDKSKFIAWLSSHLNKIDGAYLVLKGMDSNFDIDNAIGVQLDTLGITIGRNRTLLFQPISGANPTMADETYRLVLKAKIAMNNWDGTIPKIYEIWKNIFTDIQLQIQDNQDMSFNAYILGYVNEIRQDLIQQGYIVPKPEGVHVNYIGRSNVSFKPYSSMVIGCMQSSTTTMSYNPAETVNLKSYSGMIVQQISRTILNVKAK